MKKKEYIKPEIETMAIEVQSQMMTASAPKIEIIDPNDPNGSGTDILSNRRRGTWGNLWSKD